ncbi:MAG: spondin domain-containing protein [Chitinophagaceae bacterium]
MKRIKNLAAIAAIMFFVSACQKDTRLFQPENDANRLEAQKYEAAVGSSQKEANVTRSFTVTVQNVSTMGLINTMRAGGTVPLSPGAWAIFNGNDPMFTEGQLADLGTEQIAEDGETTTKIAALGALSRVRAHGVFGPAAGPILSGQSAHFSFNASPGDRLQFETMFVQSNDWFYGFSGKKGLQLFNGNTPITGDVTSAIDLYDAGTEADTAPGTGPDQKPVQLTDNQGPSESVVITEARVRHPGFTIPANNRVIRVTITAN